MGRAGITNESRLVQPEPIHTDLNAAEQCARSALELVPYCAPDSWGAKSWGAKPSEELLHAIGKDGKYVDQAWVLLPVCHPSPAGSLPHVFV